MEDNKNGLQQDIPEQTTPAAEPAADTSVDVGTVSAENGTASGKPAKKPRKKLTKKKIIIISVASVMAVILIALSGVLLWLFVGKANSTLLDSSNLQVYMENDMSVGTLGYDGDGTKNSFDLATWFGEDAGTFKITEGGDVASISGTTLTVNKAGPFKMTVSKGLDIKTKNVTAYDAVNVTTFKEFVTALNNKQPIVLQADIELDDATLPEYGFASKDLLLTTSLYGNGHRLYAEKLKGDVKNVYGSIITVRGTDITVRDLQMFGKLPAKDETMKLEELDIYGILLSIDDGDVRSSVNVTNCIFENANRAILVNASDVYIKGSILRNCADACISIDNNNDGPTNVTVENCALADAGVTAINSFCLGTVEQENFATINLKGFVDIYNWKNTEKAQIVPRIEGFIATAGNKLIQTELNSGKYNDLFYVYKGKNYIHFGVFVMCTNTTQKTNYTVVNDYTALGYNKIELPVGSIAGSIAITMCDVYGYDVGKTPAILPDGKLGDNQNLYLELRNGRAA